MANTINQPSKNPTNKLTASVAATSAWGMFMAVGTLVLKNLYPAWYDPDVILSIAAGMPTVLGFIAGWVTKDNPNIVVVMEDNSNVQQSAG